MVQTPWADLDDSELLGWSIRKLGLRLEESPIQAQVAQLYGELDARGLVFHPPCHLGDEWFVPVGMPVIFIPFYLAHDRLRSLEMRMMLELEGGTPESFMKLIRHEAAHAYSYAYNLHRRRTWRQTFGLPSSEETPFYRPRPYSRSYVLHLDDWYAQAHPDEDFAETFAVWLTPGLDWRARYQGWKALRKLEYVDSLMKSIAGKPPSREFKYRAADYDCLGLKLKTFYARKRKLYEDHYPDFYDKDLRKLFPASPEAAKEKASVYLRRRRRQIINAVCGWTNERKYRVDKLVNRIIDRCATLDLGIAEQDTGVPLRVSAFITSLVMNYLFTGRFKREK